MKLIIFFAVCYFIVDHSICLTENQSVDPTVVYKIENLEIAALLNVSLTSDVDYQKASIVYKWKYGDLPVQISSLSKENSNKIFIRNDVVHVDPQIAEKFLKYFGKFITRLSIAYDMVESFRWHKLVGKYVNEYCAETLIEFSARDCKDGVFENMTKPFTKVERVAFEGMWKKVGSDRLGLDELFPELVFLNLSYYSDGYILDRVFPKLVELIADVDPSPDFSKFIEKNGHLKKLRLKKTSMELLHVVNENLPDLEVFDFNVPSLLPSYNDTVIEFKDVKEISIKDNDHYIRMGKIVFKQLKKLQISFFGQLDEMQADFIGSNEQLELLIIEFGSLNDLTLLTFASKLQKLNQLVEVAVRCDSDISIESIANFLHSNPQLKVVKLIFDGNAVFLLNDLSEKLANDWILAPVNKHFTGINMRRLNATLNNSSANTATENESNGNSTSHIFSSAVLTFTALAMAVKGIMM